MTSSRPAPRRRLTALQRLRIVQAREADPTCSPDALARQLRVSRASVYRVLASHDREARDLFAQLVQASALEQFELWCRANRIAAGRGFYQGIRDLLTAGKVIDPKGPDTAVTVNTGAPVVSISVPFLISGVSPPALPPAAPERQDEREQPRREGQHVPRPTD